MVTTRSCQRAHLKGVFCVCRVVQEVLKREEDLHLGDLIATGGLDESHRSVNTVMTWPGDEAIRPWPR